MFRTGAARARAARPPSPGTPGEGEDCQARAIALRVRQHVGASVVFAHVRFANATREGEDKLRPYGANAGEHKVRPYGQFNCSCRNSNVPTPWIVCGPSKNSIVRRLGDPQVGVEQPDLGVLVGDPLVEPTPSQWPRSTMNGRGAIRPAISA